MPSSDITEKGKERVSCTDAVRATATAQWRAFLLCWAGDDVRVYCARAEMEETETGDLGRGREKAIMKFITVARVGVVFTVRDVVAVVIIIVIRI